MVLKTVHVRGHMRTTHTGKRVRVQEHTREIEGATRPEEELWFHPTGHLSGWSKGQKKSTRMAHLREEQKKRGRGQITRDSKRSTAQAVQALANVTEDEETERKARADAKTLFRQLERMPE